MYSFAWMNGQHQQAGPTSQSSQAATLLTRDTMRNQQNGTANNSCLYRTVTVGVQPPQTAHFTFPDGAYSKTQRSNWRTSAVPHQAVSSQQPAGGKNKDYYPNVLYSNSLNSTNMQSGYPCLPVTNGFQDATKYDFNQNSAQNSKTQIPPKMMNTYIRQDMSAHHGKQSIRTWDGNVVSDLQHSRVQKSLHQNGNGKLNKPYLAYITTATSLPRQKAVCTRTLMSSPAHNRQAAHTQTHIQNFTQHGFSPSNPSTRHSTAVSQSFGNNSLTTNSSLIRQIRHDPCMKQKTQQHSGQLNSEHNNGGEATSSLNSNSNSCKYETSCFLQKTNELPLNFATDARQQMLSSSAAQVIARNADSLHKSYPAGSDDQHPVHTSSPYIGKQFVSEVRMTECSQTMKPVTSTVTESYNSNNTQLLPLPSGQSLPNTTQGVMSRTQHIVNALPPQTSAPVVFYVTTADGNGKGSKTGNAFSPENNSISKKNLVGSSRGASQLMQMPENNSPQRTDTQSSVVDNREMLEVLEMLSSVKHIDSSNHSSPGRTGTRAVAVVQPLSQDRYQVANKHTSSNTINQLSEYTATDKSLSNPEKFISPAVAENRKAANLKEGFQIYPENPNQMRSNKSIIRHSAASNDGTVVSSSDSAGSQYFSQKQLCADDKGSEQTIKLQVDQHVAPAAQQSRNSEVPLSQNANMDKSEMPAVPKACFFDLSSIPTSPWKAVALINLIQDAEKAQMELQNFTKFSSQSKLLSMFWVGNIKMLVCKLKTGWYKDLITDVKNFLSKHVTSDSVILSQVKNSSWEQLESYHVLKDNEVYSELPYRSSWLNVNEQLDDIDKEFGFPWSFRYCLQTLESGSQPDPVGTVSSIPAEIVSEVPKKVLSQTECEDKQASTIESTSSQTSSPLRRPESADCSDPYYSFEIQVLPPEEAKIIFGQVQTQSKIKQSMDMDSPPEKVMKSSVEDELPDLRHVTLSDSELENKVVSPIEQVCCIARWMEKIVGSDTPSLSKCQCKKEQSHKDCTDRTLDKEETTVQNNDKLCAIRSESKFHSAIKGENQVKAGENTDNQIITCSWSDLWNDISVTIDLTEDDEKPHSHSDKETKNISHISINDSQSSIILKSESEDEYLSSSESEIPNQIPEFGIPMSDPEEEYVQDQLITAGSSQSSSSDNTKKEIKKVFNSEVASHMPDPEEHCAQGQLTSTDVEESSFETNEEKTQISASAALQKTSSLSGKNETFERKRKTPSSHEHTNPFLKKLKKCKPSVNLDSEPIFKGAKCETVFVDATDNEPSSSNYRTVELVLFGSARQRKCVLNSDRKIHVSSPASSSDAVQRPPEVLFVNLNPSRRKSSIPTNEYSYKRVIYEKWWRSYLPTTIRRRRKLKTPESTFASLSGVSLKKAEMAGSANTKELAVSSEMKDWNGNTKRYLRRRRRRRESLSNRLRLGEENTRKDAVTLKRPDQKRSNTENGSHAVTPLKGNNVLRFSVLPNTFNFVDGSNGRKETTDPMSDNSDLVEVKDKSPSKSMTRTRGTWYSRPEKTYCLLRSPPVPKTSSLFKEFQRKFMEKTQPSTDK
ncbi:uncharacterized protein si:ch211-106e7.2 [Xiphias gladius]|uniref:uncharacterized protein si:ch211-106e7.2 n=1 Tax=Xiphias gladius TaxID=8245 RepID=UPI001A99C90E|nr:uncharacterized protein si:ch211-106e7.2 [Xiphias gladius]